MPIPYRDADELDELGTAAYLKIDPSFTSSGYLGALFLINARGEPVEFEEYLKRLLERKGWRVSTTPLTRDKGIDLIAKREDEVGVEVSLYIQCKNLSSPVGIGTVRELNGALPKQLAGARGVLVCPSGFTADAIAFAKERGIALWDRHHLETT